MIACRKPWVHPQHCGDAVIPHLRDRGRRTGNLRSFLGTKRVGSQPESDPVPKGRQRGMIAVGKQAQNVWMTALKELASIYPQV